jgi:hypothetical protein
MKALDELRAGIAAMERLLLERCKVREGIIPAHHYY